MTRTQRLGLRSMHDGLQGGLPVKSAVWMGDVRENLRLTAGCPQCGHANAEGIRFCGACGCTLHRIAPPVMTSLSPSLPDRRPRPCWPPPVDVATRPRERGDFLARTMHAASTPAWRVASPDEPVAADAAPSEGRSWGVSAAGCDRAPGVQEASDGVARAARPRPHGQMTAFRKEREPEAFAASGGSFGDDVFAVAVDDPLRLIPREALDPPCHPPRVLKRSWRGHPAAWLGGFVCTIAAILSGGVWWASSTRSPMSSDASAPRAHDRASARQAAGTLQLAVPATALSSGQANEPALGRGPTIVAAPMGLHGSGTESAGARAPEAADQAPVSLSGPIPPLPGRGTSAPPQGNQAPAPAHVAGAVDPHPADGARPAERQTAEGPMTRAVSTLSADEARRALIAPASGEPAALPADAARACTDAVAALALCDRP